MIRICDDPKGEAYGKLIDYAVSRCSRFVLVVQDDLGFSESGKKVLAALEPHLIEKTRSDQWPGTRILDKTAWVCYYRCSEKAAEILKEAANSLFSWQQPALPEDLSFLTEDGTPWLVNTAHESWAGIKGEPEEAISLSNSIQGLFLRGEFNEDFEAFIRDAVRHQPESLEVAGYRIRKLPEEIGQLHKLKQLKIFEGFVEELPGWIGNLTELQTLSVLTRDLREIPKEIGKLENLRRLEIGCGSYLCEEGEEVEPLGEPRLSVLPEEIGRLKQLEYLSIGCTSITRLPREIGNLYNLKSLRLNSNSIEALPAEIGNLKNLEFLWLDKNKLKGLPDTIGSLSKLRFLSMSDNELSRLPDTLYELKALTYINLHNNNLPESEIHNVKRHKKIEITV